MLRHSFSLYIKILQSEIEAHHLLYEVHPTKAIFYLLEMCRETINTI